LILEVGHFFKKIRRAVWPKGKNKDTFRFGKDCVSLDDFYNRFEPLGLYGLNRRFLHLEIDIVNRCNLRCIMCFHSLNLSSPSSMVCMTPDQFSTVAQGILPHAYRLTLSLGNEPLMSPHFIPILEIATGYRVAHVNFFTNGLLLDDRKIDAILENAVTQVCISIDGATASTYNSIRRGGDFHRLLSNVENLIRKRDRNRRDLPRVRFDMVLMRRNIHEIVELINLAASLGVSQLNFAHLVSFHGLGMEKESLIFEKAASNQWLEKGLARADELGLEVQFHPAPFELGEPDSGASNPEAMPYLPTPYCPYPFFHVTMGPGCHMLPCPFSHGQPPYGVLSDEVSFEQIWLGPKFMKLRQRILDHDPPGMCRRCAFLSNKYPGVESLFSTRRN
jgi:MoaA/NifB/PqqE/SkfB family radical SAM enzyme